MHQHYDYSISLIMIQNYYDMEMLQGRLKNAAVMIKNAYIGSLVYFTK